MLSREPLAVPGLLWVYAHWTFCAIFLFYCFCAAWSRWLRGAFSRNDWFWSLPDKQIGLLNLVKPKHFLYDILTRSKRRRSSNLFKFSMTVGWCWARQPISLTESVYRHCRKKESLRFRADGCYWRTCIANIRISGCGSAQRPEFRLSWTIRFIRSINGIRQVRW